MIQHLTPGPHFGPSGVVFMQVLRAWVMRTSPLEAFYPLCTPLGRFEGLGEVPPVRFDHAVLNLHYIADIHALAVVIELADIDLSAVNMMPPRQGMHIPS
jgi:hypothetical protein